jgi:hypothetical protein
MYRAIFLAAMSIIFISSMSYAETTTITTFGTEMKEGVAVSERNTVVVDPLTPKADISADSNISAAAGVNSNNNTRLDNTLGDYTVGRTETVTTTQTNNAFNDGQRIKTATVSNSPFGSFAVRRYNSSAPNVLSTNEHVISQGQIMNIDRQHNRLSIRDVHTGADSTFIISDPKMFRGLNRGDSVQIFNSQTIAQ